MKKPSNADLIEKFSVTLEQDGPVIDVDKDQNFVRDEHTAAANGCGCLMPERLQSLYLMVPLRSSNASKHEGCVDLQALWSAFSSLFESVKNQGHEASLVLPDFDYHHNDNPSLQSLEPDWELVRQCLASHDSRYPSFQKTTLFELLQLIDAFTLEKPDRDKKMHFPSFQTSCQVVCSTVLDDVVDFKLFVLRSLLIYTPYSGLFYRIKELRPSVTPNSTFKLRENDPCPLAEDDAAAAAVSPFQTYGQYIEEKYGLKVDNWTQSMVEVRKPENWAEIVNWIAVPAVNEDQQSQAGFAPIRRHKNTPSASARRKREQKASFDLLEAATDDGSGILSANKSLLIPSLCIISPLKYYKVRQLMLTPRIIFDIERQGRLLDYFSLKIYKDISLDYTAKPSVSNIVKSLTGPTACLSYDYERLEILGDSFLKYTTTIDIYTQFHNYSEGGLSSARQAIVSNSNLSKVGSSLDISTNASFAPFTARLWSPPNILALVERMQANNIPVPFCCNPTTDSSNFIGHQWKEVEGAIFDPWNKYFKTARVGNQNENKGSRLYLGSKLGLVESYRSIAY